MDSVIAGATILADIDSNLVFAFQCILKISEPLGIFSALSTSLKLLMHSAEILSLPNV